MTTRSALPPALPSVFTVRDALQHGVSPGRMRSRNFDHRVWGVRMPAAPDLHTRTRAALLGCGRNAFLCGPTAAAAHGMPIPWRVHPVRGRDELDIATPGPGRAVRRTGIRSRSLRVGASDVVERGGVRVMSPARTWCDLTRWCSLPELVGIADWLIRTGVVAEGELEAAVRRLADRRGTAKLTGALSFVDSAAESPKESELRVLVALAGLPRPTANVPIVVDGVTIARVDLLFEPYREVLEYHGDHHRTDQRQWRRDRTREAELESLGYHVTEVTAADLQDPGSMRALMTRIARNLRRRGWRGALDFSPWFPVGEDDKGR